MALFDRDLHSRADVGAYVGIQFRPRCPSCRAPNPEAMPNCPSCQAVMPAQQATRLVQGALTDGTLRWFHLARWALTAAQALNRFADWLEKKHGQ